MRRFLSVLALVSVPVLMMFQVWQSYRFIQVSEEVVVLEAAQREQVEKNKRLLAGLAVYGAPARVYQVAEENLGLQAPPPQMVVQVRFPGSGEDGP